ncbi:MAG: FAD-dependent monooxygenase [Desmonostoc vinosum HA7617-LM4]|jgi:kynurenine 3-monooxygenase|nr:FAD-dependent monooxygenase [Desmonostoc vinosum HA7617-LM4]
MGKKVAIVGAGPCGVLLAYYLLQRDDKYQVDIYERRSDPRAVAFSKSRTFPISLNERAMSAFRKIEGLEEAVKAISLEMIGTIFHQKNGKTRVTTRKKPLFTLDRTSLVILLLEKITQKYNSSRLDIHFNCQCTQVDLVEKKVKFQKNQEDIPTELEEKFTVSYDLLVGADGARSMVRENLLSTELFECEQKYVINDYKSIVLPYPDEQLEVGKVHSWMVGDDTLIVLLHQLDRKMSGVILFPHNKNQITNLSSKEEVIQFFQENTPEISQLMPESEAEAFLNRPISRILTVRCNRYHFEDHVLLLGDAAHAVSSSIGQGCNAALEDVVLFDRLLDEYADNLAEALNQFTIRRQQDAHALVELGDYAFPASRRLLIEFVFRELLGKTLHQLFPRKFAPSLSELIFETTVPYSEILNQYQSWISKVKKSNEKFLTN